MPPGMPGGAMCVQRFDDSLNSAIHITYRISLRSSSMREPRDPLLKVFSFPRSFLLPWRAGLQTGGPAGGLGGVVCARTSPGGRPRGSNVEEYAGVFWFGRGRSTPGSRTGRDLASRRQLSLLEAVLLVMILPQVHLRKPCYDFYFL